MAFVGWYRKQISEVLRQICPTATQPSYTIERLTWDWTQVFALRGWRLNTCLLLFCVLINLTTLANNHKSCVRTDRFITKNRWLAYLWCNCWQSVDGERIGAIVHHTVIVIWHSETGDIVWVIFIKIVFLPWWRTEKLNCTFTVFTELHSDTVLYCCSWKFNVLAM
jgi:hypothetical protein